jgi:hypothetical protein
MGTLNRRDMLQLGAACGLGAAIGEAGFSKQATATDTASAPAAKNHPLRHGCFGLGTTVPNGL